MSATVISAKPFFVSKNVTDDDLGESSGFLGSLLQEQPWIRPAINYRGMYYTQNIGQEGSSSRYIHMQLDGNLTVKALDDRLIGVATFGYAPVPERIPSAQKSSIPTLISREHYLGFRPWKEYGIYAGMMDVAYGLRIPDHVAYSRTKTFLAQNDQTHGILLHAAHEKWEAAIHGVFGNLFQETGLRLRGLSATGEVELKTGWNFGISGLILNNNYRQRKMGAIHTRVGYGEGASVLAETGVISEVPSQGDASLSHYLFFQTMNRMVRGVHFLYTTEYYGNPMFGSSVRYLRTGPSLQYFPMQRVELRFDLMGTRLIGQSTVNLDTFSLMSQIHISL